MSTDLLTTLRDAAPTVSQDDPALRRSHSIMEARRRAVAPRSDWRRFGRAPYVATAAVVALTAPLTAANLIQETDELPAGFVQTHANWLEHDTAMGWYGVDPATAEPLDVVSGPDGEQLHVYVTPGAPWCASVYVYVPATTNPNPYAEGTADLSFCRQSTTSADPEGAIGGSSSNYRVFAFDIGDATRAEVTLSDGATLAALVHDHVAYGWLPPDTPTATLIGYDRGGAVTRTHELTSKVDTYVSPSQVVESQD